MKWYVQTGAAIKSIQQIGMIKSSASTIQVDLNLVVSKVCGHKVGHVVEKNGMNKDAHGVIIEDTLSLL